MGRNGHTWYGGHRPDSGRRLGTLCPGASHLGMPGVALCLGLLLGSCSNGAGDPPPASTGRSSSAPSPSPESAEPSGSLSSPKPQASEPLALVVAATRTVADVPVGAARRLLRTGKSSWQALGQSGERFQAVSGGVPEDAFGSSGGVGEMRSAGAALREVRRDSGVLALMPASTVDPRVRVLTVGGVSPLRHPDRYPLQVATGDEPGTVVTATLVDDVMLAER